MTKLYSAKAEALAIRALCSTKPDVSNTFVARVNREYFHTASGKEAYRKVSSYIEQHGSPPTFRILLEEISLSERAREFLANATSTVRTVKAAEELVISLDKYRKTRGIFKLAETLLDDLKADSVEPNDLIEKALNSIANINNRKAADDTLFIIGVDSNIKSVVDDLLDGEDSDIAIPTGFNHYDQRNGGFFRSSLVVIGGASGAGKSLLAGQIGRNQAMFGYKVGFVPLEMSITETTGRALSSWSGIDNTKVILKRTVENERDLIRKKFRRAEKKIIAAGGQFVMYKPKEDQTIQEVFASIHSLNLDIIYIDYISLLKGADTEDQWRQLGIIARHAKIYADAYKKSIVLLCQVNEDGKIRYSQAIKEHAATAWVFGSSGKDAGILNISQLKARNQDASPFTLKVDYASQSVREFTSEELDQLSNNQTTVAVQGSRRKKAVTDENDRTSKRKQADDDEYMPNLSD